MIFIGFSSGCIGFLQTIVSPEESYSFKEAIKPVDLAKNKPIKEECKSASKADGFEESKKGINKLGLGNNFISKTENKIEHSKLIASNPIGSNIVQNYNESSILKEKESENTKSKINEEFKSIKIHNSAICSIVYHFEEGKIISSSISGEMCVLTEKGIVVKKKDDLNFPVLQFLLINRSSVFTNENEEVQKKSFSIFQKVIDESTTKTNEFLLIKNRFKRIKKERKVNLNEFIGCFYGKKKEASALNEVQENGNQEENIKIKKELEEMKKINAKLLNISCILDKINDK